MRKLHLFCWTGKEINNCIEHSLKLTYQHNLNKQHKQNNTSMDGSAASNTIVESVLKVMKNSDANAS